MTNPVKPFDLYTYNQLMDILNSLDSGYIIDPDIRPIVFDRIRRSAEKHKIDLAKYEIYLGGNSKEK